MNNIKQALEGIKFNIKAKTEPDPTELQTLIELAELYLEVENIMPRKRPSEYEWLCAESDYEKCFLDEPSINGETCSIQRAGKTKEECRAYKKFLIVDNSIRNEVIDECILSVTKMLNKKDIKIKKLRKRIKHYKKYIYHILEMLYEKYREIKKLKKEGV